MRFKAFLIFLFSTFLFLSIITCGDEEKPTSADRVEIITTTPFQGYCQLSVATETTRTDFQIEDISEGDKYYDYTQELTNPSSIVIKIWGINNPVLGTDSIDLYIYENNLLVYSESKTATPISNTSPVTYQAPSIYKEYTFNSSSTDTTTTK